MSATGKVFAIADIAVNPPLAAAMLPVATVSESSRPGSRRWVCKSTRPGMSKFFFPSSISPTFNELPISEIVPSLITTSTTEPSSNLAFLIVYCT